MGKNQGSSKLFTSKKGVSPVSNSAAALAVAVDPRRAKKNGAAARAQQEYIASLRDTVSRDVASNLLDDCTVDLPNGLVYKNCMPVTRRPFQVTRDTLADLATRVRCSTAGDVRTSAAGVLTVTPLLSAQELAWGWWANLPAFAGVEAIGVVTLDVLYRPDDVARDVGTGTITDTVQVVVEDTSKVAWIAGLLTPTLIEPTRPRFARLQLAHLITIVVGDTVPTTSLTITRSGFTSQFTGGVLAGANPLADSLAAKFLRGA